MNIKKQILSISLLVLLFAFKGISQNPDISHYIENEQVISENKLDAHALQHLH